MKYQTKAKAWITTYLKENTNQLLSNQELYELAKQEIGLTTIYRITEELEKNRILTSFVKNRIRYYQYNETHEHLHMTCSECHKIIHLPNDLSIQIQKIIQKKCKIEVDIQKTFLNGICESCIYD